MARETRTVEINGTKYELTQMGAVEGRRLSVTFAQICGAVLPHLTKMSMDDEALKAIAHALNDVDPDKLEPLWKAYAKYAVAKPAGKTIVLDDESVFDEQFAGDMIGMWKFFIESSKLNFADFLAGAFAAAQSEEKAS